MFDSFNNPSYFGSSYGIDSHTVECYRMSNKEGDFQGGDDPLRVTEDECLNQIGGDDWDEITDTVIEDEKGWNQIFETIYHNVWTPLGHCYKCIPSWQAPTETEPEPSTSETESSEEEKDEVEEAVSPGSSSGSPSSSEPSGPSTSPSAGSSNGASSSGSGASRQNLPSIPVYKQPWFWSSLVVLAATGGAVYYLSRPVKR